MNIDINNIKDNLSKMFEGEIKLIPRNSNLITVETPFYFSDGDPFQLYISEMPDGKLKLSDMGHTLMHLSYDNDIDKFREGTRGNLFEQVLAEFFIKEEEGEFYIETPEDKIIINLFKLGQALTKITDLTFLNRFRAESTFYEDLYENILKIVSEDIITKDYIYEPLEYAKDYPIDYCIKGKHAPLFLFGIPNRDKARLTNIVLERLLRAEADFDSLLVFSDQTTVPRGDLARLSNTGGEMIASLDAFDDLQRKVIKKSALEN